MSDKPTTRTVSLTPEIEAFITGRIASGRSPNANRLIPAALHPLREDEGRQDAPCQPNQVGAPQLAR